MRLNFPAVEVKEGRLALNQAQMDLVKALLARQKAPFLQVTFQPPFRPRSTGRSSQCARVNGFVAQIALFMGEDFDTVKIRCKQKAIARGWPFVTVEEDIDGVTHEFKIAMSEAKASVEDDKILIEVIEQFAADIGCVLIE